MVRVPETCWRALDSGLLGFYFFRREVVNMNRLPINNGSADRHSRA